MAVPLIPEMFPAWPSCMAGNTHWKKREKIMSAPLDYRKDLKQNQSKPLRPQRAAVYPTLYSPLCHSRALHNHRLPHPLRPCSWVLHKERHAVADGVEVDPKLVQTFIQWALELEGEGKGRNNFQLQLLL